MKELPLYGGAMPQLANPSPQLAASAAAGDYGQLAGKTLTAAAGVTESVTDQFARVNDAGAYNRQQADERAIIAKVNQTLTENPYAYLSEDGAMDEHALDEAIDEYRQQLRQQAPKYMLPGSRIAADQARESMLGNLKLNMQGQILKNKINLARENFKANLDAALALHDYDAARQVVDSNTGTLHSPDQARNYHLQIAHQEGVAYQQDMYNRAKMLVADDPVKLAADLEDGTYDDVQEDTRIEIERLLKQAYRPSRLGTRKGKDGKEEIYEMAPTGLPDYMVEAWVPKSNREIMGEANWIDRVRPAAVRWASAQVTRPDDPQELDRVKTVFKEYGLSDKLASDVVDQRRRELLGSADFNLSQYFDALSDPSGYLNAKERDEYVDHVRRIAEIKQMSSGDRMKTSTHKDFAGKAGVSYTYADEERTRAEKVRILTEKAQETRDRLKAGADVKWYTWRDTNPKATPREQARKYMDFMTESAKDLVLNFDKSLVAGQVMQATDEHERNIGKRLKYARIENKKDQMNAARTDMERARKYFAVPVDLTINRDFKASKGLPGNDTEAVIYVPTGSNIGTSTVLTTGNHTEQVRIIERDDVDRVVLSRHLRDRFASLDNPYFTIRFYGDMASLLMQPTGEEPSLIATPENEPVDENGEYTQARLIDSGYDMTTDDGLRPI